MGVVRHPLPACPSHFLHVQATLCNWYRKCHNRLGPEVWDAAVCTEHKLASPWGSVIVNIIIICAINIYIYKIIRLYITIL